MKLPLLSCLVLFAVLAGVLPAGTVSDVKLHAGYLVLASSDKTEIYDLTVSPMAKIAEIGYGENSVPINMEIESNRLFIYHYLNDYDNGIYIYDISAPESPVFMSEIRMDERLIQGGFVAHGQWHKAKGGRFYAKDGNLYYYQTAMTPGYSEYFYYMYKYNVANEISKLYMSMYYRLQSGECSGNLSFTLDEFMVDNGKKLWVYSASWPNAYYADLADFLDDDSACFDPIAPIVSAHYGNYGGPVRFIDQWAILRSFGEWEDWQYKYSGFMAIDPYADWGAVWFYSDFGCPWSEKHGGRDSGITYDNSIYDVQDILVKNADIYMTSYFTKSVAYTQFYQDWNGYAECQPEKWNFYDLEAHPYGMAAANGVLYVAAEDGLHEFPLIHPDEKLPEARITEMRQEGNLLTVRGKARDDEGIRAVWVRLGHAHVSKAGTPTAECRHCPPVSLWDEWEWRLETTGITPGEYNIKVIIEDKDGDFTALSAGTVRIGDAAKVSKGPAAPGESGHRRGVVRSP